MVFISNDNVIRKYIKETSKLKQYSKAEQIKMFNEYQLSGDIRLKNKIINSNLMWVVKISYKYCRNEHHLGDIINHGNLGLFQAFDRFDSTKDTSFTTFATWFIELWINTYLKNEKDVHIPENVTRILSKLNKIEAGLKAKNKNADISDVVREYNKETGTSLDMSLIHTSRQLAKKLTSVDDRLSTDDSNHTTVGETLYQANLTDERNDKIHNRLLISNSLSKILDEREKTIIEYKFGFNGEELELSQIADILNLTRERVGQIYKAAIKKLSQNGKILKSIM